MTTFSVRKAEQSAIVRLLDDGGFESAEKLANAILKESFRLLLERDFFVTIMGEGNVVWGYGLSATRGQAEQMALHGPARIVNIASAARKMREIRE